MWFHFLCSRSCFWLVGNTQGCGLRVRLDRLRGRLLSLFLQCMWFFFYVFLLVILSLGYYFTVFFIALFTTGVLWVLALAIGEQASAAVACLWKPGTEVASGSWCFPSVKSVRRDETSEDTWCRVFKKSHLQYCFRHVVQEFLTLCSPGRRQVLARACRQVGSFIQIGHSFLIIYNLCPRCIAQHDEHLKQETSWTSNFCCFLSRGTPNRASTGHTRADTLLLGLRASRHCGPAPSWPPASLKNNICRLVV